MIDCSSLSQLSENYSTLAASMLKISEIYKKAVENEGSLLPKKAAKDPNAPKKPFTPYILFCNDERDTIRKKFPKYTSQQISRELGVAWKGLSEDDKAVYLTRHIRENEVYGRELEEYKAKQGVTATLEAANLISPTEIPAPMKLTDSEPEEASELSDNSSDLGKHSTKGSSESEGEYEIDDDGEAKPESPKKRTKTNGQYYKVNGGKKRVSDDSSTAASSPESTPPPPSRDRASLQKKKSTRRT
ncbi:Alpha-ketoglutarate-dependent dioxygenase alkB 4, variant 2 [Basidiobolus ranarum]|uniref:Alpha-ketoglutarate-dependent dioxygenase alkB 4, variant 2 n=1 Tax=Basidiobolus ranarum TaxID=34480 RepID=A0ABR2VUG0_9FUNG